MYSLGKYFKKTIVIFLFGLCWVGAIGQGNPLSDLHFEHFTTDDVLPFDKLNCGVVDKNGFVWMSSVHGIMRYDGYDFMTIRNVIGEKDALVKGRVVEIIFDGNDDLWIGGTQGTSRMDMKTGEILNLADDVVKYPMLGEKQGRLEIGPKGNVWILSDIGINKINVNDLSIESWSTQNHIPDNGENRNYVSYMSFDKMDENILWIGGSYGLLKFDITKGEYEHFLTPRFIENREEFGLKVDLHTYVYADSSGMIYTGSWAPTRGKFGNPGMHRFNSKTEKWDLLVQPDTLTSSQSINYIEYKSENELWIGSPTRGLGVLNTKTNTFSFAGHDPQNPNSIRDNEIRFCLKDKQGNLIVATMEAFSVAYAQRNIFEYHELIPDELRDGNLNVTDMIETSDYLLVATYSGKGLYYKDKSSNKMRGIPVGSDKSYGSNSILMMKLSADGLVYLTTRKGLWVFDPETLKVKEFVSTSGENIKLEVNRMYAIAEDQQQRLWIGTASDGLVSISADRSEIGYFKHQNDTENSLVSSRVIKDICIGDKDRIWISTYAGVSCYYPDKDEFVNYSNREVGDRKLLNDYTHSSLTDTLGRQWVSSYVMYCIDESQPEGSQMEMITIKDGLPGSLVRNMKRHPDGTFWLVTDNGLVNFNPYDHSMKVYTYKDGLPRTQMWDESIYITDNGEIRLFTNSGYVEFNPNNQAEIDINNVVITDFEINRQSIGGIINYNSSDTLELSYKDNFFSFKYATLNYSPKPDNKYYYMLEGVDGDWVNAGTRRYAEYTDVEGGLYTFKVKAQDRFGNESEKYLSKYIFVATPYWKTWWFIGLMGLLAIGVVSMIVTLRIRTIRREKDLKMQVAENEMIALRAQMNPHFLFNTINSIKRFIIKNETVAAADHLTKFSRLVRLILNNSNSKTIPLKDEIAALKLYVDMEMMRFDDKFDYAINIDETLDLDTLEVPPMLIQPFVENAIWHGLMHKQHGRGELKIDIKLKGNTIECIVNDNGIGRKKAAEIKSKTAIKKKSLGMTLTEKRIELLESYSNENVKSVEIMDLYDENELGCGTEVTIRIPVDYS